jgi:ubiquitin-conjugating enzyme E2 A
MDIIQDQWSPIHNICTILTSIQSLLTDPNCASPANPDAANVYQNDRAAYNRWAAGGRAGGGVGR